MRTGGIDSFGTLMKAGVPNSFASHRKGQRNRMLWRTPLTANGCKKKVACPKRMM